MKLKVCSVRDSALDAFSRPFFVPTNAMAIRGFRDQANQPETEIFKHPMDYELFELGEFDEETGKFENLPAPRSLGRGVDFKETRQ